MLGYWALPNTCMQLKFRAERKHLLKELLIRGAKTQRNCKLSSVRTATKLFGNYNTQTDHQLFYNILSLSFLLLSSKAPLTHAPSSTKGDAIFCHLGIYRCKSRRALFNYRSTKVQRVSKYKVRYTTVKTLILCRMAVKQERWSYWFGTVFSCEINPAPPSTSSSTTLLSRVLFGPSPLSLWFHPILLLSRFCSHQSPKNLLGFPLIESL